MTLVNPPAASPAAPARAPRETLGRVLAVSGAQVTIGLTPTLPGSLSRATVGKFLGVVSGNTVIVGLITEISERPQRDQDPSCRNTARMDRRARDADERPRAAADLQRHQHQAVEHRHAAAGPDHFGPGRRRAARHQALRRGRHHRRRQIERRRHSADADSRRAAGPPRLPDRPAQRVWPLLRRQGAGADAAQSAAAVLAVQFRGNGRRILRRPPRHRRRARDSVGSDPGSQGRLCAAQGLQRPRADQKERHQDHRLRRRYAGAVPHRGSHHRHRRPDGQAREPLAHDDLQQAASAYQNLPQPPALRLHVREPPSAATPWRRW